MSLIGLRRRSTPAIVALLALVVPLLLPGCTTPATTAPAAAPTAAKAAATTAPAAGAKPELIVAAYGGLYNETLAKDTPKFEAICNCKVTYVAASGEDVLIRARNKEVDVLHGDPVYGYRGDNEKLFEELKESEIPVLKDVYTTAKMSPTMVATNIGVYGLAYNKNKITPAPTSWSDLWKPEYKGKVTMRSFRPESISLLVMMAKLNGGSEDNIDPGFKKMAELKPNINAWYKDHAEALSLAQQEQTWLTLWTNGRAAEAKDKGAPLEFAVPKEGGFALVSTIHIVKGGKNVELAKKYVNWLLGPEPQVTMAKDLAYGPTNRNAKLDAATAAKVVYGEDQVNKIWVPDWKKIVANWDAWAARWDKEVVQ